MGYFKAFYTLGKIAPRFRFNSIAF